MSILSDFNAALRGIATSQNNIRNNVQAYLNKFCGAYNSELNKNSEPLFKLIKTLNEASALKVKLWLRKCTSLDKVIISDKGCKLVFKQGFEGLQITDSKTLWWAIKIDVQPIEYTADRLKKSLNNLLAHYTKEDIQSTLRNL